MSWKEEKMEPSRVKEREGNAERVARKAEERAVNDAFQAELRATKIADAEAKRNPPTT